jgi:CheY-like chemotaxis protein
VTTAASASEALASLAARPCDVVVSDLAMPEQSGFWLIAKIRQLFPRRHVPVIAVTGHPFPPDGVRRAGFDGVMQKPPDPDALCAAVAARPGGAVTRLDSALTAGRPKEPPHLPALLDGALVHEHRCHSARIARRRG